MADRIRAGIVGTGLMGTVHARAVRSAAGRKNRLWFAVDGAVDSLTFDQEHPDAALTGERPAGLPTFADGLRAARITDAVLTSSRTSQWVEVVP